MKLIIENNNSRKYKSHQFGALPCKWNHILLNPANSFEHEMKKCAVCYDIQKNGETFITEAWKGNDRIDIVNLTTGDEIEIDFKHGNIKELKNKGRTVIKI